MARVAYEDCSGQSSSVDKASTFEVCSNNPNSFQYDPSLWRVEEVGMCSEDPTKEDTNCNKYKITTRGGKLIPAKVFFYDCNGEPVIDTLRARGGYTVEICASSEPVYIDKSTIDTIKTAINAFGATYSSLIALLAGSLLDSRAPIVESIGPCDGSTKDKEPPTPAGKYFELVPCDDTPVSVYTQRQPSIPNERVGISNPQDVGVSGTVNWTYNGQSTNVDNPGVFALSVVSKNTSGCTDSEIDEPDDNGLGQNPYQIEIRTNLNSGVASLNINGSQRSISTSNTFIITNPNPVSANDFRNVPTLSYSVGDVVEVTESSGEVRNYTVSDVEERSFKGGTQSIKKLSRGESLQYIGQGVNFNVIYTIYLESSGDVIDTDRPDQPVTGGPDGNTTGVRTGPGNTSTNDEVFGPR